MPAKILHILNTYLPETENWLYHLLKNTKEPEHHIFSLYSNDKFQHDNFTFYKYPKGRFLAATWDLNTLNPLHWPNLFYYRLLAFLKKDKIYIVSRLLKDLEPHIIHFHFADVAVQFLSIIEKCKLPIFISFYGLDYEYLPYKDPRIKKGYDVLFAKNITFICEGEHGKKLLESKGCPTNKIKVCHLGVNLDSIQFKPPTKKINQLQLLQVASFTEKKGYFYTIQAIKKALPICPNLTCILVGNDRDGKTKERIKELIIEEELQGIISLIDFIPQDKLHDFMKHFDAFIHPSCYTAEFDCEGGAPIILLEAQALGLPVISTIHCDIPEEVINRETGILTEEKNIDALALSIIEFYQMTKSEFEIFAYAARKHIEKNYDIKKNSLLLEQIYWHNK
jgi:colanic acid/amylovoran biosynthesis glycosyltransferase